MAPAVFFNALANFFLSADLVLFILPEPCDMRS